jgi:pimeloyl-ACP methyl ester carboxylesterase
LLACLLAALKVVSFDRYGVGFSDENTTNQSPTVSECVRDAMFCMETAIPNQDKWIILGPSMGAIVGQCMIAQHPDRFVGFLNMDGFPAAFECKRDHFLSASKMWNMMSYLSYTGVLRFGMMFASLDDFASDSFSTKTIKAQVCYTHTKATILVLSTHVGLRLIDRLIGCFRWIR